MTAPVTQPGYRPSYIRATHPSGFRSGQWARITGIEFNIRYGRPVYVVRFVDGTTDRWPVYDGSDPYEFSPNPGA